jgi:hypothetical protein
MDMELQGINCGLKCKHASKNKLRGFAKILQLCMMHKVPGLNTTTGASDLVRLKEEKICGINTWDVLFQFFLPQFDSTSRYYHEQAKST